ncbi:MAG: RnfH family protein [Legionellales bacterium]|nr:RnfH family protein [Legionellales bacterium]HAG61442.1 RnfH family protein [Coxiellaceae bacterium]
MGVVTVAYATLERQVELDVMMRGVMSVSDAIDQSGILQQFPDIDLDKQPVGINSRKVNLDALVESGDRVEIFRELHLDPMQARHLRAARKKTD